MGFQPRTAGVRWHWATPRAQAALSRRSVPAILTMYREINHLTIGQLADLLGYTRTYVSFVESGRRTITDVGSLRHIARTLDLPATSFGVVDDADGDHIAMIEFGESVLRLAETARRSGHASEAVAELWPLAARLEARVADGHADQETLRLLARASTGLGVALGHVLPEERLAHAARWTGKGLTVARRLNDLPMHSHALRMHGNELRKARLIGAALDRLGAATSLARTPCDRADALILLARAAGTAGRSDIFDDAVRQGQRLIDDQVSTPLFSAYSLHEVQLRGLTATGRIAQAADLLEHAPKPGYTTSPSWRIIAATTAGQVLKLRGDDQAAADELNSAIDGAIQHRLPHQLQRILRASHTLPDVQARAAEALGQLRRELDIAA